MVGNSQSTGGRVLKPGQDLKTQSAAGAMMRAPPRFVAPALSTADMVLDALRKYEGKGGMSLQAIKNYVSSEYQVDMDRYVPLIRKYILKSVVSGALIRTKGVGVSGSFKLGQGKPKDESKSKKINENSAAGKKKHAGSIKPKNDAVSSEKQNAASLDKEDADAADEPLPKVKRAAKEKSKPKETKKAVPKKAKKPALMLPKVIKKN